MLKTPLAIQPSEVGPVPTGQSDQWPVGTGPTSIEHSQVGRVQRGNYPGLISIHIAAMLPDTSLAVLHAAYCDSR
ncbi:MAG: hypothetical protein HQ518_24510 [Rhodopirellula sp.]|nr:hypothetical protein [Rhodopirellula sp.]